MAGVLPITCMLSYFACSYFNIIYYLDVQKNYSVSILLVKMKETKGMKREERKKQM
jgi:hypothetical protein